MHQSQITCSVRIMGNGDNKIQKGGQWKNRLGKIKTSVWWFVQKLPSVWEPSDHVNNTDSSDASPCRGCGLTERLVEPGEVPQRVHKRNTSRLLLKNQGAAKSIEIVSFKRERKRKLIGCSITNRTMCVMLKNSNAVLSLFYAI